MGNFLAVGPSDELDTEEQVEALEQVDRVLRRADLLSGIFFSCFLATSCNINKGAMTWGFDVLGQDCFNETLYLCHA